MESKQNNLQEAKIIFEILKTDEKKVLFSKEKFNLELFKKLKKSTYENDAKLLKLINVTERSVEEYNENNNNIPRRSDSAEKREID